MFTAKSSQTEVCSFLLRIVCLCSLPSNRLGSYSYNTLTFWVHTVCSNGSGPPKTGSLVCGLLLLILRFLIVSTHLAVIVDDTTSSPWILSWQPQNGRPCNKRVGWSCGIRSNWQRTKFKTPLSSLFNIVSNLKQLSLL